MAKKKVKDLVAELLKDFLSENGLKLFLVEYVKEGREWYLRVYIDKPDNADGEEQFVDIEECELVSRFLSERLDEADPIADNYFLEVSSPGLDRPLIYEEDFQKYAGRIVDVSLFQQWNGKKQFSAVLHGLREGNVLLEDEAQCKAEIPLEQISKINLAVII